MQIGNRPKPVTILAVALAVCGALTFYVGLSAAGYLVPAAMLFAMAALIWFGKAPAIVRGVVATNAASGALLILVLAFGSFLGARKLDISGVALLINLLTGGPLLGLFAAPLLMGLRKGKPLAAWFSAPQTAAPAPTAAA